MIAVWESLDCESVGAAELEQIQRAVAARFGEGAVESPASLARVLADEGAVLRHPEVLEADIRWRKRKLSSITTTDLDFTTLLGAAESMSELERLRNELTRAGNDRGLRQLRETALGNKAERLLLARSSVISESERNVAKEIAGWLDVWLSSSELFRDWLDLRRASPEYRDRFGM